MPAGLLGNNFLYMLELAKKNVIQPDAAILPCAATMYVMGIEVLTNSISGFGFAHLNKYRSATSFLSMRACDLPRFVRYNQHMPCMLCCLGGYGQ